MRKIVTDNGRIIRGNVFENDPTHLRRCDLTDVATWVMNVTPDMSIVEVCVDEDEEGNATYRYIIMEDRTVQDEGLTVEELNKSLESYIADDDFFGDVEWGYESDDPRMKCLEAARDELNNIMRKSPWKDAEDVLDQYWEEHWREIVPTLPEDEEEKIWNDENYVSIIVHKDNFPDLFTDAEIDKSNVTWVMIKFEYGKKWFDEWNDKEKIWNMSFTKWNRDESTANETDGLAEWLKAEGFQLYRADSEDVIAKKQ